jgi:hypothetical protein
MLGQTLVLMQIEFLNNVRKVVRLVLSRTSCFPVNHSLIAYRADRVYYTNLRGTGALIAISDTVMCVKRRSDLEYVLRVCMV